MNARFLAPLLLASSLLTLAAAPAVAQPSGGSVLLLGVQRAGRVDLKLTRSLRDSLVKNGQTLAKDAGLAPPERLCANEECLSQLASREGVSAVLAAQMRDAAPGASANQYITLMMFDSDSHAKAEESTICDKCTPPQLIAALSDLGLRLLRAAQQAHAAVAAAPTPTPDATPSPAVAAQPTQPVATPTPAPAVTTLPLEPASNSTGNDFFGRWPRNRKVAAGVLAGLLVAALIPTIALFATDGQDTSLGCAGSSGFCKLQNKSLWAAGFGVSGALAVGIGITFAWPQPKPANSTPTPAASQPLEISSLPMEAK